MLTIATTVQKDHVSLLQKHQVFLQNLYNNSATISNCSACQDSVFGQNAKARNLSEIRLQMQTGSSATLWPRSSAEDLQSQDALKDVANGLLIAGTLSKLRPHEAQCQRT